MDRREQARRRDRAEADAQLEADRALERALRRLLDDRIGPVSAATWWAESTERDVGVA